MNMVKFSIVIPIYNVAPYLRACLDSLLAQTVNDPNSSRFDRACWEAICVDDGSPDACPAILDEYAQKDDRFRIVHKKNEGVAGLARNVGIEQSIGEWLIFLDGDDVLNPNALEKLIDASEKFPDIALFRFGYEEFNDGAEWRPKPCVGELKRIVISNEISFADFFVYMWQFSYRRDAVGSYRFLPFHRVEDRAFICPFLLRYIDEFVSIGLPLYGYRQREGSMMHVKASEVVMHDEFAYRILLLKECVESRKKVDSHTYSFFCNFLTGNYLLALRGYDKLARRRLWELWFSEVSFLASKNLRVHFNLWQRFVFLIGNISHSKCIVAFLVYLKRAVDKAVGK